TSIAISRAILASFSRDREAAKVEALGSVNPLCGVRESPSRPPNWWDVGEPSETTSSWLTLRTVPLEPAASGRGALATRVSITPLLTGTPAGNLSPFLAPIIPAKFRETSRAGMREDLRL